MHKLLCYPLNTIMNRWWKRSFAHPTVLLIRIRVTLEWAAVTTSVCTKKLFYHPCPWLESWKAKSSIHRTREPVRYWTHTKNHIWCSYTTWSRHFESNICSNRIVTTDKCEYQYLEKFRLVLTNRFSSLGTAIKMLLIKLDLQYLSFNKRNQSMALIAH